MRVFPPALLHKVHHPSQHLRREREGEGGRGREREGKVNIASFANPWNHACIYTNTHTQTGHRRFDLKA